MKYKTDALVKELAGGVDVEQILQLLELTPRQAAKMLRSRRGRAQVRDRRQLASIHALLVAHRFSSFAVHRLCELLQSDKPEVRLKGALSVLKLLGLSESRRPAKGAMTKGPGSEQEDVPTGEDVELYEAVAEVLARRRSDAERPPTRGAPPLPPAPEPTIE